jgi:hypothetical protein
MFSEAASDLYFPLSARFSNFGLSSLCSPLLSFHRNGCHLRTSLLLNASLYGRGGHHYIPLTELYRLQQKASAGPRPSKPNGTGFGTRLTQRPFALPFSDATTTIGPCVTSLPTLQALVKPSSSRTKAASSKRRPARRTSTPKPRTTSQHSAPS